MLHALEADDDDQVAMTTATTSPQGIQDIATQDVSIVNTVSHCASIIVTFTKRNLICL